VENGIESTENFWRKIREYNFCVLFYFYLVEISDFLLV
jgi:hypothetical protein